MTYINFNSSPTGAKVYLDGKSIGTTSIRNLDLKKGTYNVKMSLEGYKDKTEILSISATDLVKTVSFSLVAMSKVAPVIVAKKEEKKKEEIVPWYTKWFGWNKRQVEEGIFVNPIADVIALGKVLDNVFPEEWTKTKITIPTEVYEAGLWVFFAPMMTTAVSGLVSKGATRAEAEKIISSLKNEVGTNAIKNWLKTPKNYLKIGAWTISTMGTATFIEFMYEEMLQTQGMGVYIAVQNKQWENAKTTLESAYSNLAIAEKVYNNFGWLSPFSWKVFKTYASATRLQYNAYADVIKAKSGLIVNPSIKGKVFNKDEFNENVSKGTSPNVDSLVSSQMTETPTAIIVRTITDGDTIKVLMPNSTIQESVRLLGIDAPDKGAVGYEESKNWLHDELLGQEVTLKIDHSRQKDQYNRILAIVMKGEENMSLKSLQNGWSIFFPYEGNIYVDDTEFKSAMDNARNDKLGIWGLTKETTKVTPVTPTEEEEEEIITPTAKIEMTDINEFWKIVKSFYQGRMYLSKKEWVELENKYNFSSSEIQTLITEMKTYYIGRMYLSKSELIEIGIKYNLDNSGLY